MESNFSLLKDGDEVLLHPRFDNPLHKKPIKAVYQSGYFYCNGSPAEDGPDYYLGDVLQYNEGYSLVGSTA